MDFSTQFTAEGATIVAPFCVENKNFIKARQKKEKIVKLN